MNFIPRLFPPYYIYISTIEFFTTKKNGFIIVVPELRLVSLSLGLSRERETPKIPESFIHFQLMKSVAESPAQRTLSRSTGDFSVDI